MYAELISPRLFNENYFAFRAALDDAYGKGIRLVALPGDYSDDAQPANINGISTIPPRIPGQGHALLRMTTTKPAKTIS